MPSLSVRSRFVWSRWAAVVVLVAGAAVTVVHAEPAHAADGACSLPATGLVGPLDDYDSDSSQDVDSDGMTDLLVGVPAAAGGGALDIHYAAARHSATNLLEEVGGPAPRAPQRVRESFFPGLAAATGDQFGAASSFADVNGDYCEDVAVGAPGAGAGRGRVVVALGSPTGLASAGAVTMTGRSAGERFGSAVAANGSDLWIGAPDRAVNGHAGAGAVDHYRITNGSARLVETYTEGHGGIAGSPESNDHFGQVLSLTSEDTLAIGIPDESIGSAAGAGMVTVATTGGSTHTLTRSATFSQNTTTVSGVAEAGDHFGAAITAAPANASSTGIASMVAVGVPDEGIGKAAHAGMVHVIDIRTNGAVRQQTAISQGTATVSGVPETGDRFGAAVQFGGFDGINSELFDLAVGSPGESLGTATNAGTVTVLHVGTTVKQLGHVYYEGSPGVGGPYTANDRFGSALGTLEFPRLDSLSGGGTVDEGDALVVSVPGRADGAAKPRAGAVDVTIPDACAKTCTAGSHEETVRDSGGTVAGEQYGAPATGQGAGPVFGS